MITVSLKIFFPASSDIASVERIVFRATAGFVVSFSVLDGSPKDHLVDDRDADVEAGVVERSQKSTSHNEHSCRDHMHRNQKLGNEVDGEKVVVLSAEEFKGVDIYGVRVASSGSLLPVVVLVDVLVQSAQVQRSVEYGVEEVIDYIEGNKGTNTVCEPELPVVPVNSAAKGSIPEVPNDVIGENGGAATVKGNEEPVQE